MRSIITTAAAAACALVFGTAGAVDLNSPQTPANPTVIAANTDFFTTGGVADDWSGVTLDITAGDVVVGAGAGSTSLEWDVGQVTLNAGSSLTVSNSSDATAPGTILNLGVLDISAGGTLNLAAGTGQNVLHADSLTAGAGTAAVLNLADGGLLRIRNDATIQNGTTIGLQGGTAAFAGDFTLTAGSVSATADSVLAVGGSMTLDGALPADAVISLTNGASLALLSDPDNPAAPGSLVVGGSGGGTIDLSGGSTLTAGDVTLEAGATLTGSAGDANTFRAVNLSVNDIFVDSADVATVVSGEAVVASGATYTIAGDNNTYAAMTVNGTLAGDAAADSSITLGSGASGRLVLDGGTIRANGGFVFAVGNADLVVTDTAAANSVLDATAGSLDFSFSSLTVNAPAAGLDVLADNGVVLNRLAVTGGVMTTDTAGAGKLVVAERAVIGSAGSAGAEYRTGSDATVFEKGLTLAENGSLVATAPGATVTLGTTTAAADLNLTSSARLDGTAATLVLADASGQGGVITVSGLGNEALGDIDASGSSLVVSSPGDTSILASRAVALRVADGAAGLQVDSVTVARGELSLGNVTAAGRLSAQTGDVVVGRAGVISTQGTDSFITGSGTNSLVVRQGGVLGVDSASLTVDQFDAVRVDGAFTVGYDGAAITRLTTGAAVTNGVVFGATGSVALTNEAALNIADSDVIIDATASGGVTVAGRLSTFSIFGTYHFGVDAGGDSLILTSSMSRIDGSGSAADRALAYDNVTRQWGRRQIGNDLGNIIYDASVVPPNLAVQPVNSPAGLKNLSIFQALGNSAGKNVGKDTLEYVNGAYLYGVTDVAMETNRAFSSDILSRAKAVTGQFVAARETLGSGEALGSASLNACAANRFWAGGFGLWQDADERQTFSGYRYDSWGAIMGYDRVVADGLALGLSAAYNKGDYADKAALAHDSSIESYTGGLYGVYSHESGFTGTLYGAYTYSDNDVSELRRDPFAGVNAWGKSKFHTRTWSVGGSLGWDFKAGCDFSITPTVGLNYIRARNSNHTSSLGGVATQRVNGARNHGTFLPVELSMGYDIRMGCEAKLRLEGGAGYAYNFNNDGMDGSLNYFDLINPTGQPVGAAVRTRENSRHNYKAGGGFRYSYRQFDLGVRYDYLAKTDYKAHRVVGSIGLSF